MGGGLQKFGNTTNFIVNNCTGDRIDRRNLVQEWNDKMTTSGRRHAFVSNRNDFMALNTANYDHILGKQKNDY